MRDDDAIIGVSIYGLGSAIITLLVNGILGRILIVLEAFTLYNVLELFSVGVISIIMVLITLFIIIYAICSVLDSIERKVRR